MAEKAKEQFALLMEAGGLAMRVGFPMGPSAVPYLETDALLGALQMVSKEQFTEEVVNRVYKSMKPEDSLYVWEEDFVKWVMAHTEEGEERVFLKAEQESALKASMVDMEAAKEAEWEAWFKQRADEEAAEAAVKAARSVKAEAAWKEIGNAQADEALADETIGDEIRKLVWLGFPDDDGPMADDPMGYKDFVDDWNQGRAKVGDYGVHFAEKACSGVSAFDFFESMKTGDDFGFSVDGKPYYGKLAGPPRLYGGGECFLPLDPVYPESVTAGCFQIIRHASNVDPEAAKKCKFYEDRTPAVGAHFAETNVCANCGVLRGHPENTLHYVCSKFVRGPLEGYRNGRKRAFCATCGMPDDYHKACAKFVPGPSTTVGKFGARVVLCQTCNYSESEHIDGKS